MTDNTGTPKLLKAASARIAVKFKKASVSDPTEPPVGAIAIGTEVNKSEWSKPYRGFCRSVVMAPEWSNKPPVLFTTFTHVLFTAFTLVLVDDVSPYIVHRALLLVEEYQALIKDASLSPAEGEPGYAGDGFFFFTGDPVPLKIFTKNGAVHFWPETTEGSLHRSPAPDNQNIEALRQAPMTTNEYLLSAIDHIDQKLGEGYAAAHPELIGAFMQVAVIARALKQKP